MTRHPTDGMTPIPGPLTMREMHAHIVEHQRIGPHSHSADAMVQMSRFHTAWVEHCNAEAEKRRIAELKESQRRQAEWLAALGRSKPVVVLLKRLVRGSRAYAQVLIDTSAEPAPFIQRYRLLHRREGADGWSQYGSPIEPDRLPRKQVMILKKGMNHEVAVLAYSVGGEVISDPVPVVLRGVLEEPTKPVTVRERPPDPPTPTDEQLRAHFGEGAPLADKWHPVVRQAIWRYQKAEQEREMREHEAGQAARDAEVERQRREFEKHPQRLARLRAAPPTFEVVRTTARSVMFRIKPHERNVCERFQVLKRNVKGGQWIASGRSWGRGDLPKLTWRGRGAQEWALRASNKYGSVTVGPLREPA